MSNKSSTRSLMYMLVHFPEKYTHYTHCPICKVKYCNLPNKNNQQSINLYCINPNRISKDHILPKCRYTDDFRQIAKNIKNGDVSDLRNTVFMCAKCNELRGHSKYNHCIATLILDRLINGDERFYNVS